MAAESWEDYLFRVRRLLHDATGNYYGDSDIIQYVAEARSRVARDMACCRALVTNYALTPSQETYSVAAVLASEPSVSGDAIGAMGITLYWGTSRIKLGYLPWPRFDAKFRYFQNFLTRPVAWSAYNQDTVYVGPVPDQAYATDWEIVVAPPENADANLTIASPVPAPALNQPFRKPVEYYAAYLAKQYEQSFGEAQMYYQQYELEARRSQAQWQRWTQTNVYA